MIRIKLPVCSQKAKDFLSQKEAAALLGICVPTLRKFARSGVVPSVRLGSRIIFSRKALENWATGETAIKEIN